MYMLRHNKYALYGVNDIDDNGKSIYDTKQVLAVSSHKPVVFTEGT